MLSQDSKLRTQNHNSKVKNTLRERSFDFSVMIIKLVNNLPRERTYWVLTDQLMRSGTSIGANIIEAKAASSKKDFIKYYEIALKSANETKYWLDLLRVACNIRDNELIQLIYETEEIAKIIAASILTMKDKR